MYSIALFCGIPGCGKTEIIDFIVKNKRKLFRSHVPPCDTQLTEDNENVTNTVNCRSDVVVGNSQLPQLHIISFDKLCSIEDQAKIINTMNGWRHFRCQLLEAAERYICEVCNIECHMQGPLTCHSQELLEMLKIQNCDVINSSGNEATDVMFLVEDNFYYKSMRYEWFQVAKRDGLGFSQIYVSCPIEVALERNQSRGYNIPEHRIKAMYACMEYPDPEKNKWEKFSMFFDSTNELQCHLLSPVTDLLQSAMHQPAEMVLNEKKIEAQIICSKNVTHQVDKVLRKLTSEIIAELKENRKNSKVQDSEIKNVLQKRRQLLLELKQGSQTLPQDVIDMIEHDGIMGNNCLFELSMLLRKLFLEKCNHIDNGLVRNVHTS